MRSSLSGRADEQRWLERVLACGEPGLLVGEAGIGKTALLDHAERLAVEQGLAVLRGHCYDSLEAGPYFPLTQALSSLNPHLVWQVGLGAPSSSWLYDDARSARGDLLRRLGETVRAFASEFSAVLIVDDIQFADVGTLLVLNHLIDLRVPGLALLLAMRTNAPSSKLHLAIQEKTHGLKLCGLPRGAIREIADKALAPHQLTSRELDALVAATDGNPLFVKELLAYFASQADPSVECFGDVLRAGRRPSCLNNIIDLRLEQLSVSARLIAETVAVFGDASADEIAKVLGVPLDSVNEGIEELLANGLLRHRSSAPSGRFWFEHDLFGQRLYDQIPLAERIRAHARVSRLASDASIALDVRARARHGALGVSGQTAGQAVADCSQAAEEAEMLLAFETAAEFWQLAILSARTLDGNTQADLRRRLGWTLWATNHWQGAIDVWLEAAALFAELGASSRLAEVSLALADLYRWRVEPLESRRWAQRALDLELASIDDRALALALIGNSLVVEGRNHEARNVLATAADYWRKGGCHPAMTWWLAHAYLQIGEFKLARLVGEQGLAEAVRRGARNVTALLANGLLISDLGVLDIEAAEERLKTVEGNTDRHDAASFLSLAVSHAFVWGYGGDWERVVRNCEETAAELRLVSSYQVATMRMLAAAGHLALDRADLAEGLIRSALPDVEAMRTSALIYLADASLRQGKSVEPREVVPSIAPAILHEERLAATRAILGHVAAELDDPHLWQACYEALRKERRAMLFVYSPTSVQRVLGRLAMKLREWALAIEHFDTAIETLGTGRAWSELLLTFSDYSALRRYRGRRGDSLKAAGLEAQALDLSQRRGMLLRVSVSAHPQGNRFGLTNRELEVLSLVGIGLRNREVAERLTISDRTVQRHLENVFAKMGAKGRADAVAKALELSLLFRPVG